MKAIPYLIAEAGVNHDGSEAKAQELVAIAAGAGADAVKFQLFDPEALVVQNAPSADYQARQTGQRSQKELLSSLSLPREAYPRLEASCRRHGIDFLCTPFDQGSLEFLIRNTQMPYIKLASGEITNGPLLLASARTGLPIVLSTGMANLEEIAVALSILHFGYKNPKGFPEIKPAAVDELVFLQNKVTLLHCVSQYPAPPESMNLRAMDTLREAFGLPVGLSDHSLGLAMPVAAAALGATMIEKHFTCDVKAKGPDHAASLSPEDLKAMVEALRDVAAGLGDGEKTCRPEEENTRAVARRSVVAACPIPAGGVFSEQNLACKRPAAGGVAPHRLWQLLGKPAKRRYAADDFIDKDEL